MSRLLIVVDYQIDFVSGSLGNPYSLEIEVVIAEKLRHAHAVGDDVIFTLDTHNENYLQTQEGRKLPVEHCIRGTKGHALYGKVALEQKGSDLIFEKSTFPSGDLYMYLKDKAYDTIEIVGVVTDICVISNAVIVKAALPEAEIIIDAKAVASNDKQKQEEALDIMESLQIKVLNR
ncbi:MAG TPA: cysteine hydrolase [Methanocorpusculum sp.]|nr:cysteine hydrolase [Methanocorpusculum sp.]